MKGILPLVMSKGIFKHGSIVCVATLFLFLNQTAYSQIRFEAEGTGWVDEFAPDYDGSWNSPASIAAMSGGSGIGPSGSTANCSGSSLRGRYTTLANLGLQAGNYTLTFGFYDNNTSVNNSTVWIVVGPQASAATLAAPPSSITGMTAANSFAHTGTTARQNFTSPTYSNINITQTDMILVIVCAAGSSQDVIFDYVDITPADNPSTPVINPQAFSVNECAAAGTAVGTVTATDADAWQTINYSITAGNTGNIFAINSSTGEITVNGALDFETTPSYSLTVQAQDNAFAPKNASATVTITVTDCTNELPPVIGNQAFSINENTSIGTAVGTATATDPENNTISYSITGGNTGNAFSINSSTGVIRVNGSLNFEALSSYSLTVQATDNGTPVRSSTATVTVTITDINENPNTPVIANQTLSINENSAIATVVDTVIASDADLGQVLTYSITAGNTGNVFAINSSTGEITVNGVLDFETTTSYALTVQVTDNGQPTKNSSATVTININDVADPNLTNPVMTDQTFTVDENSSGGTVIGNLTATDVEWWQTLTYTIIAADSSGVFALNPSGQLTLINYDILDFETKPTYTLTVVVYDNGTDTVRTDTATVTININDLTIETGATGFPFKQRTVLNGPFDIHMIAAPNLQPVYLDPTEAISSRLLADSLITQNTLHRTGNLMEINNRYKGGSPFVQKNIPLPAVLCTDDPNTGGCILGYNPDTPDGGCPVKYNGSTTVSKYVSMTYADYDTDPTTFSSSMALLNTGACGAQIERAYLYWTGDFKGSVNQPITLVSGPLNSFTGDGSTVFDVSLTSGHNSVLFKVPGGSYEKVTATAGNTHNMTVVGQIRKYMCVADVTDMVQGITGGQFWVGNIQSYPNEVDGGSTSGWTLVFVYQSPLSAPRMISIWDGFENITQNNSRDFNLTGLTTPPSSNFNSYMGFAALDGENLATQLGSSTTREGLGVQTFPNGSYVEVNPFATDQPTYKLYDDDGFPAKCNKDPNESGCGAPLYDANWCSVFDGVSSSHITSYSLTNGKNGNEITRLPSNKNTLGYDSHHMKLPDGTVQPGDVSATLTVRAGPQGATMPFLAYVAIESVEPKLDLSKIADTTAVTKSTPFSYILTVKNEGTAASFGNDTITDNLPVEVDYNGSIEATKYVNGVASAASASLVSNVNDNLIINIVDPIGVNDSVVVKLNVKVIDDSLQLACKREIENTAFLIYTGSAGNITVQSNSSGCSTGANATVAIFPRVGGELFQVSAVDACDFEGGDVIAQIQEDLLEYDPTLATAMGLIEIKDDKLDPVVPGTVFPELNGELVYHAVLPGNCDKVYKFTYICSPEIIIPNLITPGSDRLNDTFQILGLNPDTKVEIYNRWGKLIYRSENYANDWKAEGNSDGLYYYHIEDSETNQKWRGWVHVVHEK